MKPTDVFVDHWTAKSLEAGSDYPAHLQFVRHLIAAVTEEHVRAIDSFPFDVTKESAKHCVRSWTGEGDKECTNS